MKILNFGSMNLDYVYQVPRFLQPGETMAALSVRVVPGGKGLNQSVALARAGAEVYHAGTAGEGGKMLVELLVANGVDVSLIRSSDGIQGNAMIQVAPSGQNAILLCGGSNHEITPEQVDDTIAQFEKGDWLILQNEVSCLQEMIKAASQRGMHIVLNPSPFEKSLLDINYEQIEWLFINEIEGQQMTGCEQPEGILQILRKCWPKLNVVLTLGEQGAVCATPHEWIKQDAFKVEAVDTTAAGDTFTGYLIASYAQGHSLEECMKRAAAASSISVSRPGASVSIPTAEEVDKMLQNVTER